jgi:UDP-N-acetylmuramoyl-tripeptide--D-alanyl-D-alanine ligase
MELSKDLVTKLQNAVQAASGYTSDSRTFRPGQIFVAMKGASVDGHDFVPQILTQKPAAIVVQLSFFEGFQGSFQDRNLLIGVDDVHEAHRRLAKLFRQKYSGRVIAVGGSSGKTTTKDFLHQILNERYSCMKTEKSQNGEQGIPKTLERLAAPFEMGVIEVGIDAPGDMIRHVSIVNPDIAVLTSIGEEHLNRLGNIENVFREEKVLFDATLARGGTCFAPANDPYLSTLKGMGIRFVDPSLKGFRTQLQHPYAVQNAALAVEIARSLGLSDAEIQRGLDKLKIPEGRGADISLSPQTWVVADHYNANLSSMRAGLAHAAQLASSKSLPRRLILGDMLDLGSQSAAMHRALVADIAEFKPDQVAFVGKEMEKISNDVRAGGADVVCFADSAAAALELGKWARKSGVILLKGSRGMELEKVLLELQRSAEKPGS